MSTWEREINADSDNKIYRSVVSVIFISAYGIYYAFDKPQLTIERGDFVHWRWQTPGFVNDINHAIYEVESISSTVAMEGGFSSGKPSKNGKESIRSIEIVNVLCSLGPNIHWTSNYGTGIVFIANMLSWLSFHNFV